MVTIDELGTEIHLPKEWVVLSRDSRSSEKFMHGIKVLMAKNYIDNVSEEARKNLADQTPLGYRNVAGPDGKKIIATDPAVAPLIARLFETYATGRLSLKEAAKEARSWGLSYPRTGNPVPVSTVHTVLHNRLYSGDFDWNGRATSDGMTPSSHGSCESRFRTCWMGAARARRGAQSRISRSPA
jgi:site-specific DNA recombinase